MIRHFSSAGGLEKYAHRIARGFTNRGIHVDVLTSDTIKKQDPDPLIHVHTIPLKKWLNFKKMEEFDQRCQAWHHNHTSDIIFGMDRTRSQTHIRAGNGVHAAFIKSRENYSSLKARLNPINKTILKIEREAFESPKLHALFTNSHMVKNEVLEHYKVSPNIIHVVHNGVEWEEMQSDFNEATEKREKLCLNLGLSPSCFHFLFIGNGYKRKGLSPLLKALSLLPNKEFHLSVIGKDRTPSTFMKETHKLGLSNHVTFYGPRSDIRQFYQLGDSLVIPSFYDPFANVTVEALAMGLFVISSKSNGGHEVLNDKMGAIIPNIRNPESLVEPLLKAMARPKTKSRAESIRNEVKHLDFSKQLSTLIDLTLEGT